MKMTFYNNKLLHHLDRLYVHLKWDAIVPLTLDIDLTNLCNSKCPGCAGLRQSETETLNTHDVILLLSQASRMGVKAVVFTGGGEPTLHPDIIEILTVAKESFSLEIAIATNGILLADKPDITRAIVKNCTWVRVSVDAGSREMYVKTHGVDRYDKVLLGLKALTNEKLLQSSNITIGAAYLTGEDTISGIESCCRDVELAGVDYFYLRPYLGDKTPIDAEIYRQIHNNGRFEVIASNAYEHLEETKKSYSHCAFGWWVSVVMADGTVTWCCRTRGNPKYSLGNIYNEDLYTILDRRKNIKVDFNDCAILCRGDEANKFLEMAKREVMHKDFL